ncbi:MAG: hypothetical protein KAW83_05270 [Dehalococcoidia bacterium]|nr:hypothetical protein [Dehalococcoidia bacterium]
MRNSPGRKQRRQLARSNRKRGDLNRFSTQEMRSKMGMPKVEARKEAKVIQHHSIIGYLKSALSILFRRKRKGEE